MAASAKAQENKETVITAKHIHAVAKVHTCACATVMMRLPLKYMPFIFSRSFLLSDVLSLPHSD